MNRQLTIALIAGFTIPLCSTGFAVPLKPDIKLPAPIAQFLFNDNDKNEVKSKAKWEFKNTKYETNSLYLNGQYEHGNADGYRAVCQVPELSYKAFTVAMRFKAEEFSDNRTNLITGGTAGRWLSISRGEDENLQVEVNNGAMQFAIAKSKIAVKEWNVIAIAVDLTAGKISICLNGKMLEDINLEKDFEWKLIPPFAETDREFSFANYSNGNAFHGWVDELIIYGTSLKPEQMERIPLNRDKTSK